MIKIHSVFATLQGEGLYAGTPALFVRMAGCNVWDGDPEKREERARFGACARICDTEFRESHACPVTGGAVSLEHIDEFVAGLLPYLEVLQRVTDLRSFPLVVFTGGEPSMQLREGSEEAEAFLLAFHKRMPHALFAMETNGACVPHPLIRHIVLSPKHPFSPRSEVVQKANEIKVLFPLYERELVERWIPYVTRVNAEAGDFLHLDSSAGKYTPAPIALYIQPVDDENHAENCRRAVAFAKQYPMVVRVSVQTHKILGIA